MRSNASSTLRLLNSADSLDIRHVLRPTRQYASALDDVLEQPSIATLQHRVHAFSGLRRATPQTWQPLVRGEIRALARGDIPRVTACSSGRTLACEGYLAVDVLSASGLDSARARAADSELADLKRASVEIRRSLTAS